MTAEQYGNLLMKRWKIIIACLIIVGLSAFASSMLMSPLYQSTILVQVTIHANNSQADINDLLASDQLVQTEAQLAVSDTVLRQVVAKYTGLSVDQLTKNVTATVKPNTQLFEVDVLDASPAKAAKIANDIIAILIQQQNQVIQKSNAQSQQQIQQDLQETQKQIAAMATQIAMPKEGTIQVNTLQTQLDNLHQHYTQEQSILTQLELTEAQSDNFLQVVQPAHQASRPSQPNIVVNTSIGLVAGLFTGFLLVILLEQLDTRIRTEDALSQLVNWPILTTIWRQDNSKLSSAKKGSAKTKGDRPSQPEDIFNDVMNVESYRILRTNIGFSGIKKPFRSIAIVSAMSNEGKSFIATNLAIFMAKAGKKTMLVDADLRKPTIGKKFHFAPDTLGLSNAVLACSQAQFASVSSTTIQLALPQFNAISLNPSIHQTDIPNLSVMPSGPLPPDPPELLDSRAMDSLATMLADTNFDVIIFDTAPMLSLSDTSILISRVDAVIIAIDVTVADKKNIKRIDALLRQSESNIIGCVINKQSPTRRDIAYSYNYYRG